MIKHLIDKALKFISDELNSYIDIKTEHAGIGKIYLKPIVKQDGSLEMETDTLSLTLINIQEEYAVKNNQELFRKSGDVIEQIQPPIHLNLFILFVANFSNYDEALKFISLIITFFQFRWSFNKKRFPSFNLDPIEELNLKLQPMTLEQQNHLWGTIGAKLMPSVLYKMSILSLEEQGLVTEIPRVESIQTETGSL